MQLAVQNTVSLVIRRKFQTEIKLHHVATQSTAMKWTFAFQWSPWYDLTTLNIFEIVNILQTITIHVLINGIFSIILFHVLYRAYTNLKLASEFFHFRKKKFFNFSLQCSLIFFPIWSASNFNFFLYKSQFFHSQFTVPIKRVLSLKQAKKKTVS